MTLIKRGILQDYTQHSGDHLCALRRGGDLKDMRGGGGEAAIRDKESCGKDFNRGQHRHNSIDLNNVYSTGTGQR